MPVYEYRGVTAGNRTTRGLVDADSARAARLKLRAEGIFPTDLSEGRTRGAASEALARLRLPQLRRVPDLHLALFTRQLATLVKARIPLADALAACVEQVEKPKLKKILVRVRSDVERQRLVRAGELRANALYSPAAISQTYDRLAALARTILESGYPAIVDATFLKHDYRLRFMSLARELAAPFVILSLRAPEAVLEKRVATRLAAAADASALPAGSEENDESGDRDRFGHHELLCRGGGGRLARRHS